MLVYIGLEYIYYFPENVAFFSKMFHGIYRVYHIFLNESFLSNCNSCCGSRSSMYFFV